jgi:ArsR family transcriptional regulator, arsenate/arsenite/antimonite-responsive transcriptional repressor / arsenate reductase (thioredoxin)
MNAELSSLEDRARIHAALGEPARLAIVDTLTLGDVSPGELGEALGLATNLVAHHVKVLLQAGIIVRTRSEGDRRRTYLRLVPDALTGLTPPPLREVPRVVFVCTHNSARSQFAAALWAHRSPIPATSAGTRPAERAHPRAVRIARRHHLALDQVKPRHANQVLATDDLVIAVCDNAHEQLTDLPVRTDRRLHWSVPDPAATDTDAAFEAAFTDIADRIDRLAPVLSPGDDHG